MCTGAEVAATSFLCHVGLTERILQQLAMARWWLWGVVVRGTMVVSLWSSGRESSSHLLAATSMMEAALDLR